MSQPDVRREEATDRRGAEDDEFDPLTRVAAEQTLAEKLMADMGAMLPEQDLYIAEYLIGSLDDKGYLGVKLVELLKEQGVHIARRTVAKYRMQLNILPSALR